MGPFIQSFQTLAQQMGTVLGKMDGVREGLGVRDITKRFERAVEEGIEFLLCLTPNDKPRDLHEELKWAEQRFQVTSQNVVAKTAMNAGGGRGFTTLLNILAKTNQKLGGLNYRPEVEKKYEQWFEPGVMYIGIDVNHPPPNGGPRDEGTREPSVVGCAWNTYDEPFRYLGDYQFQEGGVEEVKDFARLAEKALDSYSSGASKRLPTKIIIFRDGVSDGQFQGVLSAELGALREACLEKGGPDYAPSLTMVVVMKRHAMRFFRTEMNDRAPPWAQNIPVGTVIDSSVVEAKSWEFFLNAHLALQGTAKTPRYVVLRDENGLSSDELQTIAMTLAFNHQIVSLPVSLPAPVFSAHNIAKRGKREYSAHVTAHANGDSLLLSQLNKSLTISNTVMSQKTFWA